MNPPRYIPPLVDEKEELIVKCLQDNHSNVESVRYEVKQIKDLVGAY